MIQYIVKQKLFSSNDIMIFLSLTLNILFINIIINNVTDILNYFFKGWLVRMYYESVKEIRSSRNNITFLNR